MIKINIKKLLDSIKNTDYHRSAMFDKILLDKYLYRYPNSKLYINPDKLIELSNYSIKKLELLLSQMIITEQLYNHLGIFTVDDKKYRTLGRSFDIEIVENLNWIFLIENDVVHLAIGC